MLKRKGFSLPEVLVSILIIALVAAASYTAFFVLSGANEQSRNRLQAIALSQAAIEEVKAMAKNSFGNLNAVIWPEIAPEKHPRFTRVIRVTDPANSYGMFKRADITVNWDDQGQARFYHTSTLLSRPGGANLANIHGNVTNDTGDPVSGALVTLTGPGAPPSSPVTKSTNASGYYTCTDAVGNPQLQGGNWTVTVTHPSYFTKTELVQNLSPPEDRTCDVQLIPKPAPGAITGRFVIDGTTTAITSPRMIKASLYQGGSYKEEKNNSADSFTFSIDFTNSNPQYFTVNSQDAYKAGYCWQMSDSEGWGKNYNYRGWSSSVVRADSTVISSNPWNGGAPPIDRVCVNSGQTTPLGDIPLIHVPTVTLTGTVYNNSGTQTISGARVYIKWFDNTNWAADSDSSNPPLYSPAVTNEFGVYTIVVPAAYKLFPDQPANYIKARAYGPVPNTACCNGSTNVWSIADQIPAGETDNWERVFLNDSGGTQNFNLALVTPVQCGNAEGYVKDEKTGSALSGVTVTIAGNTATTSGGNYSFNCGTGSPYFKLPIDNHNVQAVKSGYYTFKSVGTTDVYASRPQIHIDPGQTTTYENIRLWPVGKGTLKVKVRQSGSGNNIEEAKVEIDHYSDGSYNQAENTNAQGEYLFTGAKAVVESLPPTGIPDDSYYKHNVIKKHTIKVSKPGYYDKTVTSIVVNTDPVPNADVVVDLDQIPGL